MADERCYSKICYNQAYQEGIPFLAVIPTYVSHLQLQLQPSPCFFVEAKTATKNKRSESYPCLFFESSEWTGEEKQTEIKLKQ